MVVRWMLRIFVVLVVTTLGVEGAIDRITKTSTGVKSTPTYPVTNTVMQYTTTLAGGGVQVVTTTYEQKFTTPYSTLYTPSQGTIGLGTIKGTVGTPKPDRIITVTHY
ncbi:hypothetical protein TRVA0_011S00430 [Trichomonascus vanleenenianus]|uniref:Kre1p n=1 Tax=Trichomonascus vanleenenianus TaxID=2268995 RepID=UPI003EC9D015